MGVRMCGVRAGLIVKEACLQPWIGLWFAWHTQNHEIPKVHRA